MSYSHPVSRLQLLSQKRLLKHRTSSRPKFLVNRSFPAMAGEAAITASEIIRSREPRGNREHLLIGRARKDAKAGLDSEFIVTMCQSNTIVSALFKPPQKFERCPCPLPVARGDQPGAGDRERAGEAVDSGADEVEGAIRLQLPLRALQQHRSGPVPGPPDRRGKRHAS